MWCDFHSIDLKGLKKKKYSKSSGRAESWWLSHQFSAYRAPRTEWSVVFDHSVLKRTGDRCTSRQAWLFFFNTENTILDFEIAPKWMYTLLLKSTLQPDCMILHAADRTPSAYWTWCRKCTWNAGFPYHVLSRTSPNTKLNPRISGTKYIKKTHHDWNKKGAATADLPKMLVA